MKDSRSRPGGLWRDFTILPRIWLGIRTEVGKRENNKDNAEKSAQVGRDPMSKVGPYK